ncbi:MAG: DUF4339 domain-containing protein [Planctomycetaceae bacterium]|nr:DUF4339 domain-containing protein [Planctomycetaceae bacterium]
MAHYFYELSGSEHGPVSTRQLATLIADGTLAETTRVREQGSSDWIGAEDVPGLLRSASKLRSQPESRESRSDAGQQRKQKQPSTDGGDAGSVNRRTPKFVFLIPMIVMAVTGIWWFTRTPRFPKPSSTEAVRPAPLTAGTELPLDQIRPPIADPPTLNVTAGKAQLVPGLEAETGVSSPTLTDDLKTIAFIKPGTNKDDIFLSHRENVNEPFSSPVRLECSTRFTEAFCSLSPNGSQLIFTVQQNGPSKLRLATSADNFRSVKPVVIPGVDMRVQHVDNPQWLDEDTIRVVIGDINFTKRSQTIVKLQPDGKFEVVEELKFQNPWPRMHLSRDRKRAYFYGDPGIMLSAPKYQVDEFGMGHALISASLVGKYDAALDDPVFVVPKEDIVFFTGSGPDDTSSVQKLWMIRP